MVPTRVIPCLLLSGAGLVKTRKFAKPTYLGDPINAVKIFNDKEADELILLDIDATPQNKPIQFDLIEQIAGECFMPLCYGGGIRSIDDIGKIFKLGAEKVCLNTHALTNPDLVPQAAKRFGSQSIVVAIDVKRTLLGRYETRTHSGKKNAGLDPIELARIMQHRSAGELLVNSIDRDGTRQGYDLDLISRITHAVDLPVIACGGAATIADLRTVITHAGASAAAAGSLFVFQGKHHAVLISFPSPQELDQAAQP
jgi:cyclase